MASILNLMHYAIKVHQTALRRMQDYLAKCMCLVIHTMNQTLRLKKKILERIASYLLRG